ncbi:CRISPR-associated helicase Cas3' [Candidatus Nitrosotenuis uzonensis]|nr:CRISPR-associated helicase Cas3' [Candidatus Nitrosotenuis uzonensis]
MSSASTKKFFSHPFSEEKSSLIEHLITVAKRADRIFSESKFQNNKTAFYSGLVHDIGKLNPFYQILFSQNQTPQISSSLLQKYEQVHSPLSAWAADKLLTKNMGISKANKIKILLMVYGHHSKIRNSIGNYDESQNFKNSKNEMVSFLSDFSNAVSPLPEFDGLDWESCIRDFSSPIDFQINISEYASGTDEFLEMLFGFSCLLQADRGSFGEEIHTKFDLKLNTRSQIKSESTLAPIRSQFQAQAIVNFDTTVPISIINAPTGIGKTKVFLDLISKFSDDKDVERVFYFSPLLALTDDFESKIENVISSDDLQDVLSYNHIFAGSIEEKRLFEKGLREHSGWLFSNESFDRKFVITTTQRLLMTLFSNKQRENLKLASFRKSVLIIDEVQVIPRILLPKLKEIFQKLSQYLGTKIILVSATIPHEISDLPRVKFDESVLKKYLALTRKKISYQNNLEPVSIKVNRTLVMLNTRQKAANMYLQVLDVNPNVMYLSTGIRKIDRKKILQSLKEKSDYVLVSTQVVEAGVDVSFSHVYREICPLDNVIQVMGRLNREGKDPDAEIVVFETDGTKMPYLELDMVESRTRIQRTTSSDDLYLLLPEYYEAISTKNKRNVSLVKELDDNISRLDFDAAWNFVNRYVFADEERDTVIIPDESNWENVRSDLLKNVNRDSFKKFGLFSASLPTKAKISREEFFDAELMEKGILLPKKEKLREIYDKNLGFDVWLTK